MAEHPILELSDVSKSYALAGRLIPVLRRVHLRVQAGEMLAILGASGSGKSTLMNIIGLLDTADSGEYRLAGARVTRLSEDAQAQKRNQTMGFVFQQFNLLPRLNAFQNVALPLQYAGVASEDMRTIVESALDKVGMLSHARHLPSQLSGGQQQRIAIARALVNSPDIILADEPTGALDSKTGQEVLALFHRLHQEGRTLLIITHDGSVAEQCQRKVFMHDGCLQEDLPACV